MYPIRAWQAAGLLAALSGLSPRVSDSAPCALFLGDCFVAVSSVRHTNNEFSTFLLSREGKLSIYVSFGQSWTCLPQYPGTDGEFTDLCVLVFPSNDYDAYAMAENGALWVYSSSDGTTRRVTGRPTSSNRFVSVDIIQFADNNYQAFLTANCGELWSYKSSDATWFQLWGGQACGLVGIPDSPDPASIEALTVHPNPFRGRAAVTLLPGLRGEYSVDVYALDGSLVRNLGHGSGASHGASLTWDGTDAAGRRVASGTYLLRADTPTGRHVAKAVVLD